MRHFPLKTAWMTLLACLAWGLAQTAWCQSPATGSEAPWTIEAVRFEGFQAISREAALEVMETKLPAVFTVRQGPALDEARLERDRLRLLQLYQENGFFDAQVNLDLEYRQERRTVAVVFTAQENAPYLVSRVDILLPTEGDPDAWLPRLVETVRLKAGERCNLKDYTKAKTALTNSLASDGHPLNQVDGQVQVYKGEQRVVIVLRVDPGPRVLFGATEVKGQPRQGSDFILRQATYLRGQPFSQAVLDQSQRALLDTGFYSSVTFTPAFERMEQGQVPIVVEVQEAKRHSLRLGLGWGTEDQFRVRILQVNRDLLGLNDTLTFEGKISHIYEGLIGRLKLPDLPARLTDLVFTGGIEQKNNEAFVNRRLFFNPMLEHHLLGHWSWYLGYNVERDRMVELKAAVPDPSFEKQQLYISSVPVGIKYDGRDSLLDPKRGAYFNLEVETASDVLGSEVQFVRPLAEVRHVLPLLLFKDWYLASRAKVGLAYPLLGTERIPLVRRFFPGGADSVRGYPFQSLGPLDSGGKPLGGEAMAEGSLEVRFPLYGELGGVAFLDAGNAWENISSDVGALRFTSGGGLRYQTPVGPIRLDVGYQLNPPDHSTLSRYEVYLSVGQAF